MANSCRRSMNNYDVIKFAGKEVFETLKVKTNDDVLQQQLDTFRKDIRAISTLKVEDIYIGPTSWVPKGVFVIVITRRCILYENV